MKTFIVQAFFSSTLLFSCANEPQRISASETTTSTVSQTSDLRSDDNVLKHGLPEANDSQDHVVRVMEVLPTTSYTYMHVLEGTDSLWIAVSKIDAKIGETYFFRDGLLQVDFHSAEYDRTFDNILLVSKIVLLGKKNSLGEDIHTSYEGQIEKVEGDLNLGEIINQAQDLEGKEVQFTARCVKVNSNIMGTNWLHFIDGSHDDFDLVVTSSENPQVGDIIRMKAKVALNKDFGAGYRYEIILEEGRQIAP